MRIQELQQKIKRVEKIISTCDNEDAFEHFHRAHISLRHKLKIERNPSYMEEVIAKAVEAYGLVP